MLQVAICSSYDSVLLRNCSICVAAMTVILQFCSSYVAISLLLCSSFLSQLIADGEYLWSSLMQFCWYSCIAVVSVLCSSCVQQLHEAMVVILNGDFLMFVLLTLSFRSSAYILRQLL